MVVQHLHTVRRESSTLSITTINRFMKKIPIVSIGGCAGYDILVSDIAWVRNFYIPDRYSGSVSRSFFKPGKIAERLHDELKTITANHSNDVKMKIKRQVDVVLKIDNVESIIKKQEPNTIIMVDPGYELSDYYDDGEESFDILPEYDEVKHYFPSWFNQKIAQHRYKFDVASARVELKRDETYLEFFNLVTKQQCLAFFIDNVATEKTYIKKLNSVATTISAFNSTVSFLTVDQEGKNTLLNFNYAKRLINRLFRRIKTNVERYYVEDKIDKAKWFDIDKEVCFADAEHRWGYHPAHLHISCRTLLVKPMHKELINLYQKNTNLIVMPS